jgi:hypothetical protein
MQGLNIFLGGQEHLLCVKHWFKELDDPQAAVGPSQAFADTPIGQSLLKLDESQRKRLESVFNTAYGVVKAGKNSQRNENFSGSFQPFVLIRKKLVIFVHFKCFSISQKPKSSPLSYFTQKTSLNLVPN